MRQVYYKTLSINYFDNLYEKVSNKLTHGQNVLISVIRGGGARTVFSFLQHHINENKLFDNIYIYDPIIENIDIIGFINRFTDPEKQNLLIIRSFEKVNEKQKILSKIDSIRRRNLESLTVLTITDHTAITNAKNYTTTSETFFPYILYIPPFNEINSGKMIDSLKNFYGWDINKNLYSKIYKLSGGLPRVIKHIVKDIGEGINNISNEERFLKTSQIDFQMERLTKLLIILPITKLKELDLINNKGQIKSKLLKLYLSKYNTQAVEDLFPFLTKKESKILTYLIESQEKTLSLDKIAEIIKMTDENFSLWAIYKTISRLRPKISKNFILKSVKGRGYMLIKN